MDTLIAVSETAPITLKSRVQEAKKDESVIRDEVAREYLAKIRTSACDKYFEGEKNE